MNRCFLCGNKIEGENTLHNSCMKRLFGVEHLPGIGLSLAEVSTEAQKMAGKMSISGIQPKLSMKLNRKKKELEVTAQGGEYILKPQIATFPNIPQNENLCMTIASNLGIDIPPHSLIKLKDNSWAYIVKRFDREKKKKIHQEDFLQVLGKEDRYKGSLEEIGKKLRQISEVPGLDVQLFYERVVFFFIIGNGDAHLENFSITYNKLGHIRISPAYDIVSSKLVIPDEEDFALSMNGKKNKITGRDFLEFSNYLKIPKKIRDRRYLDKKQLIEDFIMDSELTEDGKNKLLQIVTERFSRLKEGFKP